MKQVQRYWHTLRYLRPVQLYGRVWFTFHRPKPALAEAPPVRPASGPWKTPARREPSLRGPAAFHLLNLGGDLRDLGWDGPQREKLWRYNQHYFDDLNAMGSSTRGEWHRALLQHWVSNNPPGEGTGWEPYPVSVRIVNWIKWALAGNELPDACLHSLAVQARWLEQRLEIHLLGNHLFANAKALVFAGAFFSGPEARRWRSAGLRILARELPEQVLPDGGHFERSTMYHALCLEDMLDLCNLHACLSANVEGDFRHAAAEWRACASLMLRWLHAMRHPDGEISFFNDAAFGVAPSCEELQGYASRLDIASPLREQDHSLWLQHTGYARLVTGNAVALADLAPVGPDYLPGHAHADTLSFELSVHGQRLLVNSGTSCYGAGAERLRQRGTAAHNTVLVGGEDSSEVWAGFRVARRAQPLAPSVNIGDGTVQVECSHDGYSRLAGRPIHRRRWKMDSQHLCVEDDISQPAIAAQARFHFHPGVSLRCDESARHGVAVLPDGRSVEWRIEQGRGRTEPSTWHPCFGVSLASRCLGVDLVDGRSRIHWTWQ